MDPSNPFHVIGTSPSCAARKEPNGPLRPAELPFTEADRDSVTILFGGLTWKHERLIEGVLRGAGYRCQRLPETDREAHELGKEFCSTGLCNPVYFTVGNLIRFLKQQEQDGLSQSEIVQRFLYFTAACGGPCRFGMYESEFRTALNAAGFQGFRILSFSQDHGIHASTGHTGLKFSVDFGMNAMHAFILGDLLHSLDHRLRPFEVHAGSAHHALFTVADTIASHFERNRNFELRSHLPKSLLPDEQSRWYRLPNTAGKLCSHLYGDSLAAVLPQCVPELQRVEVDWLRVKPVIKVIGEFWAQMTESDGNFRMIEFLEQEGAEASVEPVSTWILYMLDQRKRRVAVQRRLQAHTLSWVNPKAVICSRMTSWSKHLAFTLGEVIYRHHYLRLAKLLRIPNQRPFSQKVLSRLAEPYYNPSLRGGEGHLEVAKTLYYTRRELCHLVLALKPFGCLPSIQSDAVQASLVERSADVNFLAVETSADGEIHARSRVQMALADARASANAEFSRACTSALHSIEEIREYVAARPALRHPLYAIPCHTGVVSTAANFLLHVDHLMSVSRACEACGQHRISATGSDPAAFTQELGS